MAVTFTGAGVNWAASGASPLAVTTVTPFAVGDFLVALIAHDNTGGGGQDPMSGTIAVSMGTGSVGSSVSAQAGINDPGAASAGLAARCVAFPVTATIPSGTVVNVSWSGTLAYRTVALMKVSSAAVTGYRTNSGATGANTVNSNAPALTTPSVNNGEGVLCWGGYEWGGIAFAGDADTTNGAWSAIYGINQGSGLSGMSAYFQSKVVTATATQTWNPTGSGNLSDWILGCLIFTETPLPAITQAAYRVYDDGTETGAVALAAQNTAANGDIRLGDGTGQLRIRLQSTNAGVINATDDWQLQWDKNASGSWANVGVAGTVKYNNLTVLGLATTTTNRLGAGTGSFVAGKSDTGGLGSVDNLSWSANNYTELLWPITITKANVVDGDVITFRVLRNGVTTGMTYSVTPTVNIIVSVAPDWPATIASNWGGWTATADGTVTTPVPALTITGFRWYNDNADPNSSTAAAVLNTQIQLPDAVKTLQLRLQVSNTDTITQPNTWFDLQARRNGGAWTAPPPGDGLEAFALGTSAYFDSFVSLTAQRIGGGIGTFAIGAAVEDSDRIGTDLAAGSFTEMVFMVQMGTNVVAGDVIEFRLTRAGSTTNFTYAQTPSIQVLSNVIPGTITSDWGNWTAIAAGTVGHPATGVSTWGTWTATAAATVGHSATVTSAWGNWTAVAIAQRTAYAGITTSWGQWASDALATVGHPGMIASDWGNWTALATGVAGAPSVDHPATIVSPWGGWTATAVGTVGVPATVVTHWGNWTAVAIAAVNHPATVTTNWGTWTGIGLATVRRNATISSNWSDSALLTELFGGGADGVVMTPTNTVFNFLSGTPEFDTAVIYKTGQSMRCLNDAVARYGRRDNLNAPYCVFSIFVRFGSIAPAANSTFLALRDSLGANTCAFNLNTVGRIVVADTTGTTIVGANIPAHAVLANNWYKVDGMVNIGASTGRAQYRICDVEAGDTDNPIAAPFDSLANKNLGATNIGRLYVGASSAIARNGEWNLAILRYDETRTTFFNAYQGWIATGVATVGKTATVTTSWGGWTATAVGSVQHTATITTSWGNWTATAIGGTQGQVSGIIASQWGNWTATALGSVTHHAVVTANWGGWTATAVGKVEHQAVSAVAWGGWTATAVGTVSRSATVSTTWDTWEATATAARSGYATITTTWGGWTASAIGIAIKPGAIEGQWEGQAFDAMMYGSKEVVEWMLV